ncbi:MAG: MATE family efflux transporter [Christensenellales bacterium]
MENSQNSWGRTALALAKFSLPLILSGVLQQVYSWVDAFIVGNVEGELALAAIGATGTLLGFVLTAVTGFTVGLSILFAQTYGRGEHELIPKILATFSALMGVLCAALAAGGAALCEPLLRLLDTPPDILAMAADYLRVSFIGLPFLAVYNLYAAALRGIGDSRAPFLAILVSSAVNIVLDLAFVAGLGWGVTGAAAATVLSQGAMTVFLVAYGAAKHPLVRFRPGRGSIDRSALIQGCRLGLPPMIQSSVGAFGGLLLQNFMNSFGAHTVAAISTAYRVDSVILLPVNNLAAGISTLVGQAHGAGDGRRARRVLSAGAALMAGVSLLLTGLIIPTGGQLIALFGVGPEAVAIGRLFFRSIAGFYLVYGLAAALRGYLEGRGDVMFSSAAGIASLACRIGCSYALRPLWGNMTIAYAEAISWGLLLTLFAARAALRRKKAMTAA